MSKQFEQVLAAAGMPQEKIDELKALPEDQWGTMKTDEYLLPLETGFKTKLSTDKDFLTTIITEDNIPDAILKGVGQKQYGRLMAELRREAEAIGIDLKDVTEEQARTLKPLANIIFERYAKKSGSPEAVQQLQTQLQAAIKKGEDFETEMPTKIESATKEVASKYQQRLGRLASVQVLAGIEELQVDPSIVVDSVHASVAAKYHVILDEDTLTYGLFRKDSPTVKVLVGSKEMSYKDALIEAMKDKKGMLAAKKADDDNPGGKRTVLIDGKETSFIGTDIAAKIAANK